MDGNDALNEPLALQSFSKLTKASLESLPNLLHVFRIHAA